MKILWRENDEEQLEQAVDTWGSDAQIRAAMEELAECIVALSHYDRGREPIEKVLEEFGDAMVCVAQILHDADVLEDMEHHVLRAQMKLADKLHRTKARDIEQERLKDSARAFINAFPPGCGQRPLEPHEKLINDIMGIPDRNDYWTKGQEHAAKEGPSRPRDQDHEPEEQSEGETADRPRAVRVPHGDAETMVPETRESLRVPEQCDPRAPGTDTGDVRGEPAVEEGERISGLDRARLRLDIYRELLSFEEYTPEQALDTAIVAADAIFSPGAREHFEHLSSKLGEELADVRNKLSATRHALLAALDGEYDEDNQDEFGL